jgi:hypothetical protein
VWHSLGRIVDLESPIWLKVFKNKMFMELPPIDVDSVELDILDNGVDNQRVPTQLWDEVRVLTIVEGDGDLRPLQLLRGGR